MEMGSDKLNDFIKWYRVKKLFTKLIINIILENG
jgi:nicotinic acid mononucleotide adenylyltransferase